MEVDFRRLDGLKVFINFAWQKIPNEFIDVLVWGDYFVGDILREQFEEKPKFKLVCLRGAAGKSRGWIDDAFEYPKYRFTLLWAILWLKEKYPNQQIKIYGLDGGDSDYYDGWNKGRAFFPDKPKKEVVEALERCYKELDNLKDRTKIYVAKESKYKGFPCK